MGGGGAFIDAPAELLNLRRVDPVAAAEQSSTPLFRNSDGSAITEGQVRQTIKLLMADVGAAAADFGAHSLRIGGATALYKAGASHIDIMTMGRCAGVPRSLGALVEARRVDGCGLHRRGGRVQAGGLFLRGEPDTLAWGRRRLGRSGLTLRLHYESVG